MVRANSGAFKPEITLLLINIVAAQLIVEAKDLYYAPARFVGQLLVVPLLLVVLVVVVVVAERAKL